MLGLIVKELFSLGKDYVDSRKEKRKQKHELEKASHEKQMQIIQNAQTWDEIQAKNSETSWKDEFWTLVLGIPCVMCFIPGMNVYVTDGFKALSETPVWYQSLLGVAIAAAFGYRKVVDLMAKRKES